MNTFPPESHLSSRPKLGGRLAGGLLLVALLWSPSLLAQQPADRSVEKSARVIERGAHHALWETVREVTDPLTGETVSVTNSYVQIETGLHYPNDRGEWVSASDKIEIIPGYAVAQEGLHQARWAANINTYGAIELWTPEGEYAQSHVLGLALHDPVTGESVMLGAIKDSMGVVSANQVVYEDAFEGVLADLRYTYTKAGFVQDVILREQLPDPAELGFDSKTVQLQVLTEFVALPAQSSEVFDFTRQPAETNGVRQATGADHYRQDAAVRIGSMTLTSGRAFGIPETGTDDSVPVRKLLERFEGDRNILIESIDFEQVQFELQTLPAAAKPTALRWRSAPDQQARLRAAPDAPVREIARLNPAPSSGLLMARLETPPKERDGFLIDYETINTSYSDYTFRSDTTYRVTGNVTMNGKTTIEGGTVVKFDRGYNLQFLGVVNCLTEPFRPAIFTGTDDSTVGEPISGVSSVNSGYYAKTAIWIDNFGSNLRHLHIRNAERAIFYNSSSVPAQQMSHVQIVNCGYGVVSSTPRFKVRNALMHNVVTNFHTTTTGITGEIEHLTSNGASVFNGSGSLTLNVTNSILVGVSSGFSGSGNVNPGTASGLFQTVGSGQYYLASGSSHRDAGVLNITPLLKSDFRQMTTYPPAGTFSNVTFTADTIWGPQVQRDTDTPDRGYHYTAVDYAIQLVTIQGAKLILTNGVSVAGFGAGTYFWPKEGGQLVSTGIPDRLNQIGEYAGVQEQPAFWGTTGFIGSTVPIHTRYTSSKGNVDLRFTRLALIHRGRLYHGTSAFGVNEGLTAFNMAHCEVYRGRMYEFNVAIPATLSNNLFHRSSIEQDSGVVSTHNWYNNTFVGGGVTNKSSGATSWTIRDNLFDQTAFSFTTANPVHNNNGYSAGTSVIPGTTSANQTLSGTPGFTTGPLGRYYLPANSPLIGTGSRSAANAGLYHHTTMLSGTKEAGTTVDIGYHYVGGDLTVTGPVGYWRTDENTGTSIGDSTSPANNGTFLNGPPTTPWPAGPQGYGLNFDGSNDYVSVADATELRLNHMSIAFWYKKASEPADWTRIVGKGVAPNRNYGVWEHYGATKTLLFQIYSPTAPYDLLSASSLNVGQWYHVVCTSDGANMRIYLNGVQDATRAMAATPYTSADALQFGLGSPHAYMPGALDEVRVYNRALDPGDVQRLYTQGALAEEFNFVLKDTDGDSLLDCIEDANGNGSSEATEISFSSADTDYDGASDAEEYAAGTDPKLASSAPVGRLNYWRFDASGLPSESGQTPMTAVNTSQVASWSGSAVNLDHPSGANLKYFEADAYATPNINLREGSVRFWFKPNWSSTTAGGTGPGSYGRLLNVGAWTPDTSIGWWGLIWDPTGTQIGFGSQTNGFGRDMFWHPGINWTSGQWHQLAVTYSPSVSRLYLDGQLVRTGLGVIYWPSASVRASYGLNLGGNTLGTEMAKGQFEELETFNYQLSLAEIQQDFLNNGGHLPDQDGDGLPDSFETAIGTAPGDADTDHDNIRDKQEWLNGLNPLVADSALIKLDLSGHVSWSERDFTPTAFEVSDGGEALKLSGNSWKAVPLPVGFTFGPDTSVRFDFRSDAGIAEINGIGFDVNATFNGNESGQFFRTFGTEAFGTTTPSYVGPGWKQSYFQVGAGAYNYVTLANNDDVSPQEAVVTYRDVVIGTDKDHDGLFDREEIVLGTNPLVADSDGDGDFDGAESFARVDAVDANARLTKRLSWWPFDLPNIHTGPGSETPTLISQQNTSGAIPAISGSAVNMVMSSPVPMLKYKAIEANGTRRFNPSAGTVRLWFKPGWAGGSGPANPGRLVEIGEEGNGTGWWGLYFNSAGTKLSLGFNTSGAPVDLLSYSGPPGWVQFFKWMEIAVSYSEAQTDLYINGEHVQSGPGISGVIPDSVLNGGVNLGSSLGGFNPAVGYFDEIEIFNQPLSAQTIQREYAGRAEVDTDLDGLGFVTELNSGTNPADSDSDDDSLPDGWELAFGLNPLSNSDGNNGTACADTDGDGETNCEEYQARTNPTVNDTLIVEEGPLAFELAQSTKNLISIDFTSASVVTAMQRNNRKAAVAGTAIAGYSDTNPTKDQWNIFGYNPNPGTIDGGDLITDRGETFMIFPPGFGDAYEAFYRGLKLVDVGNRATSARLWAWAGPYEPLNPALWVGSPGVPLTPFSSPEAGDLAAALRLPPLPPLPDCCAQYLEPQWVERYGMSMYYGCIGISGSPFGPAFPPAPADAECLKERQRIMNEWRAAAQAAISDAQVRAELDRMSGVGSSGSFFNSNGSTTGGYPRGPGLFNPLYSVSGITGMTPLLLPAFDAYQSASGSPVTIPVGGSPSAALQMYSDYLISSAESSFIADGLRTGVYGVPEHPVQLAVQGLSPGAYRFYIYAHGASDSAAVQVRIGEQVAETGSGWSDITQWHQGGHYVRLTVDWSGAATSEDTTNPMPGFGSDFVNTAIPNPDELLVINFDSVSAINGMQILRLEPLEAPRFLTGFDNSNAFLDGIVLKWSPVPTADGYRVYRRPNLSSTPFKLIASTHGRTYVDRDVEPNSEYDYYLEAFNERFVSSASEILPVESGNLGQGNQRPVLNGFDAITLGESSPGVFELTYAQILSAADVTDKEGDPIQFQVDSVLVGELTVIPSGSSVLITPDSEIEWDAGITARIPADGIAFIRLRAFDGHALSLESRPLTIKRSASAYLLAWGQAENGALGNGEVNLHLSNNPLENTYKNTLFPVRVLDLVNPLQIADNGMGSGGMRMAIGADYSLRGWGLDDSLSGLFAGASVDPGLPRTATDVYERPVAIPVSAVNGQEIDAASAALSSHALVVDHKGRVWSWGQGGFGQLGRAAELTSDFVMRGYYEYSTDPGMVDGLNGIVQVAADSLASVALGKDGSVWWWGTVLANQVQRDQYGYINQYYIQPFYLNDTPGSDHGRPNRIRHFDTGSPVIQVAAAGGHYLALHKDGTVSEFGRIPRSTLPGYTNPETSQISGNYDLRRTPVLVPGLDNPASSHVKQIATGGDYSVALRNDGTVVAWGRIGVHEVWQSVVPAQIAELKSIEKVSVSQLGNNALALDASGKVWSWGFNYSQQLGRSSEDSSVDLTPDQIGHLSDVTDIVAGGGMGFVITSANDDRVKDLRAIGKLSRIDLSWRPYPGAIKYAVFRDETPLTDVTPQHYVGTTATAHFSDTGVENNRSYFYRVAVVEGGDYVKHSYEAYAIPVSLPATPVWSEVNGNLAITEKCRDVTLNWVPVPGATSYRVYRAVKNGSVYENERLIAEIAADSFRDTRLDSAVVYGYRLRAVNSAGESEYSERAGDVQLDSGGCIATPAWTWASPAKPAVEVAEGQATLYWNVPSTYNASPVTSYSFRIKIKYEPDGRFFYWGDIHKPSSAPPTQYSAVLEGLENGRQHWFTVSALVTEEQVIVVGGTPQTVRFTYETPDAVVQTATPYKLNELPVAPATLQGYAGLAGQGVHLRWTDGINAQSYAIETWNGTTWTPLQSGLTGNGFWHTTATPTGSTYRYRVTAVNAHGPSTAQTDSTKKYSPEEIVGPDSSIPDLTSSLAFQQGAFDSSVFLRWNAVTTGQRLYVVDRKPTGAPDTAYEQLTEAAPGDSFVDAGVVNGSAYVYRLTVMQGLHAGFVTSSAVTPTAQGGIGLTANAGNSFVELTWPTLHAQGYQVYAQEPGTSAFALLRTVRENSTAQSTLSFRHTGLKNGLEYAYYVVATGPLGIAAYSDIAKATPSTALPPLPPENLEAALSAGKVLLTWDASPSTVNYKVEAYKQVGQSWTLINSTDTEVPTLLWPPVSVVSGDVLKFKVTPRYLVGLVATLSTFSSEVILTYKVDETIPSSSPSMVVLNTVPSVVWAPTNLTLSAAVTVPGVERVDFLAINQGVGPSVTIGSAYHEPYTVTWYQVPAGTYRLQAVAVDAGGRTQASPLGPQVEVQVKIKPELFAYTTSIEDVLIPAPGLPLSVSRSYDSRHVSGTPGVLGKGWKAGWENASLTLSGVALNQGWIGVVQHNATPPLYTAKESSPHLVTVNLPNGQSVTFTPYLTLQAPGESAAWLSQFSMGFESANPGDGFLECTEGKELYVRFDSDWENQALWLTTSSWDDTGGEQLFQPSKFTYYAPDGSKLIFSGMAGGTSFALDSIEDPLGNKVTMAVAPSSPPGHQVTTLTHSNGRTVEIWKPNSPTGGIYDTLVYDPVELALGANKVPVVKYRVNAVTALLDEVHHLRQHYNLSGGVELVYDVVTYKYVSDRLTEIYDPRGIRVLLNAYHTSGDNEGLLTSQTDARLKQTTYGLAAGVMTIDPPDTPDNEIINLNSAGNVSSVTDGAGETTQIFYDQRGRPVEQRDEQGGSRRFGYDDLNRLTLQQDELGNTTNIRYDERNNPESVQDAKGNTSYFSYDDNGSLVGALDAGGAESATDYTDIIFPPLVSPLFVKGLAATETRYADDVSYAVRTHYVYDDETGDGIIGDLKQVTLDAINPATGNQDLAYAEILTEYLAYDANGNRKQERRNRKNQTGTPVTITTHYKFDALNRVVETRMDDQDGDANNDTDSITTTVYDKIGKPASSTDAYGRVTTYTYDVAGNLIETKYPDNTVTRTVYDGRNRVLLTQERALPTGGAGTPTIAPATENIYESTGRLVRVRRYEASEVRLELAVSGAGNDFFPLSGQSPVVHKTTWQNKATQQAGSPASVTRTVYGDLNRVLFQVNTAGGVTGYEYDKAGRRISVTNYLGYAVPAGSIETGNISSLVHSAVLGGATPIVTRYGYDGNGNQIWMQDPEGNFTDFEYDAMSRRTVVRHAQVDDYTPRAESRTGYDGFGRHTWEMDEEGVVTGFTYDHAGNLLSVTQDAGSTAAVTTRYKYDELGQLMQQIDAEDVSGNRTTKYDYDQLGRRIKRILPGGTLTETVRYKKVTLPSSAKVQHRFATDFNGQTLCYIHDELDRLKEIRHDNASGATQVAYTYDHGGRRKTMADTSGTTSYFYNAQNQLTQKLTPQGHLTYAYHSDGKLQSVSTKSLYTVTSGQINNPGENRPSGIKTIYGYDSLGRLQTVNGANTYAYHPAGTLWTVTYPNNYVTTYGYNTRHQLTDVVTKVATATKAEFLYDYVEAGSSLNTQLSPTGRRNAAKENFPGAMTGESSRWVYYQFDGVLPNESVVAKPRLSRLTRSYSTVWGDDQSGQFGLWKGYTYSQTGNRTATASGAWSAGQPINYGSYTPITASYDERDRQAPANQFDSNGNFRGTGGNQHTYDRFNRLTTHVNGGITTSIAYDGDGHRVRKTRSGTTTYYLVDELNPTGYAQVIEEGTLAGPASTSLVGLWQLDAGTGSTASDGSGSANHGTLQNNPAWGLGYTGQGLAFQQNADQHVLVPTASSLILYSGSYTDFTISSWVNPVTSGTVVCKGQGNTATTTEYALHVNGQGFFFRGQWWTSSALTVPQNVWSLVTVTYSASDSKLRFYRDGQLITTTTLSGSYATTTTHGLYLGTQGSGLNNDFHGTLDDVRLYRRRLSDTEVGQLYQPTVTIQAKYTYGLDLMSQDRNGTVRYYGYDGLGSARYLTDGTVGSPTYGQITDRYQYDAYGRLDDPNGLGLSTWSLGTATPNHYRYTGEQWDADLGLYYLRARYYDPQLGRFWTMDSYEGSRSDPLSLHKYLYASANPVMNTDPSGHLTLPNISVSTLISSGMQTLRTVGVATAKRAAVNSIYGAIIGSAVGQWDAIIAGEDPYEGLANGAVGGAAFGALGSIRAIQPIVGALGVALGVDSVLEAVESGNKGLALYRAVVGAGLTAASLGPRINFTRSIWELPYFQRGIGAQKRLARTEYKDWYEVGEENRGFFEVFDFQKGNVLVSLKTVDTRGHGSWKSRVRKYVRDIRDSQAKVGDQEAELVLDLRVPPGRQADAAFLIEYGAQQGVRVQVSEIQ